MLFYTKTCLCVLECSSTLTGCEELSQRLEQLQRILKAEPDEEDDELLDIISVKDIDAAKVKIKLEQEEAEPEPKFFLGRCPSTQLIRDTAEQVSETEMFFLSAYLHPDFLLCHTCNDMVCVCLCVLDRHHTAAGGGGEERFCSSRGDHDS